MEIQNGVRFLSLFHLRDSTKYRIVIITLPRIAVATCLDVYSTRSHLERSEYMFIQLTLSLFELDIKTEYPER